MPAAGSRPAASIAGRGHHVAQLALDLVPAAGLQAAVGVDPQVGGVHERLEVLEPIVHRPARPGECGEWTSKTPGPICRWPSAKSP